MKFGIILLFSDNENEIKNNQFINLFNKTKHTIFCFVNNASKDDTLKLLKVISRNSECNISILDIKKEKKEVIAIKAGARYLYSAVEDLKFIVYANMGDLTDLGILKDLFATIQNTTDFKEVFQINTKRGTLKNVFPIHKIINNAI
ncbi:hypothetical protein [Tenacibaculum sp. UWU-22]|uniref:hypothetical protein n=1 Tax=Tenacibaculum sp. UWU-22 TaxID=3234187 RepID=UPI0034DAE864